MRELLTFLYQFYEQGDYAHKSLNDFFDKSTTQWDNLNSIHDLKDRINKMIKAAQIDLDNDTESFRGWGEIENGKPFNYRDTFPSPQSLLKGTLRHSTNCNKFSSAELQP